MKITTTITMAVNVAFEYPSLDENVSVAVIKDRSRRHAIELVEFALKEAAKSGSGVTVSHVAQVSSGKVVIE